MIMLFGFFLSMSMAGATLDGYQGAAAVGLAGGGRGAVLPSSGHFLNPASVAFFSAVHAAVGYESSTNSLRNRGDTYAFQMSEAAPENLFAGSLSAVKRERELGSGGLRGDVWEFQLTGAVPILPNLGVGVSARRGQERLSSGDRHVQNNGTIGVLYQPAPAVSVGVVGYDLLPASSDVPEVVRWSRRYAAGTKVAIGDSVFVYGDVIRQEAFNPGNRWAFSGAIENRFFQHIAVRLGYGQDDRVEHKFYTAGLGLDGPRLRLNYGVALSDGERGQRHSFDLWMPF